MLPRGLDLLGVPIPDEQAHTMGLVLIGVVSAVLILAIGRKARRLAVGMVVAAAVLTGLALAVRAGMIPDPRSLLPGLPS